MNYSRNRRWVCMHLYYWHCFETFQVDAWIRNLFLPTGNCIQNDWGDIERAEKVRKLKCESIIVSRYSNFFFGRHVEWSWKYIFFYYCHVFLIFLLQCRSLIVGNIYFIYFLSLSFCGFIEILTLCYQVTSYYNEKTSNIWLLEVTIVYNSRKYLSRYYNLSRYSTHRRITFFF